MEKDIVLVNSDYILREIINNPMALRITQLFKRLENKYGDCVHTSKEIEVAKELTRNFPSFLDESEKYTLPLTNYQIINDTLSKGDSCILYKFSIPQLQTFRYDFINSLENLYICNENLEKIKLKNYLKDIKDEFITMKPVNNFNILKIKYYNDNKRFKNCLIKDKNLLSFNGNFLFLNIIPEFSYNEVTLKILNGNSNSIKYNINAFNRLLELSSSTTLPKEIKETFPNFLVYDEKESCVGYGYNNPLNDNLKTLKGYLEVKAKTDNSEKTFSDLLQIAKKFLCVAKMFQSYNIYFYNMDLEDFKVILDNNGDIDSILPINCENLCINGITTNNATNEISKINKFSKRYKFNQYQSYFYDNFLLYIVLKIITLDIDNKDYKILKDSINKLKFSSTKYVSNVFEKISWYFFDELGDIFIENRGHFSVCNMIDILNICEFDNKSLFNKFTKRGLFNISISLLMLCIISLVLIAILIL